MPRSVGDIAEVFSKRHWFNLPYYRPVSRLTMVVQKYLHGDHAGPFHLFNAMLMGLAALLAFALLRSPVFAIRPLPALIGAALFAVHPIASVCVYPICSGRETLMPAVFTIASLTAFLRPGRPWYILALLMFAFSLFCKEQAIILPGLFVLADVLGLSGDPPGRSVRRWIRRYAPVTGILLSYFLIRWLLFGGSGEHRLAVFENPSGPLLSLLYTLQTTFVPFVQLVYEPWVEVWMSPWRVLMSLLVVVLLAVWAYRCWPAVRTAVLFWLGCFFLALLPTANLLDQEAHFAERYGFLAMGGVIGIIATLASTAWDRPAARRLMTGVGTVLLVACAAISFHRGRYFQDNLTFHTQWLRTNPLQYQAHTCLGTTLVKEGKIFEAITHYNKTLRIRPDSVEAHTNLGFALESQGRTVEAIKHYKAALRINPNSEIAHLNLGLVLTRQGKTAEATNHYKAALRINPYSLKAHYNLGTTLAKQGRTDKAIMHLTEALRIRPDHVEAHINLANVLLAQGKLSKAIQYYSEALRIRPDSIDALSNLNRVLAAQGKIETAIARYQKALKDNPENPAFHYILGNLYKRKGELDGAIDHYEKALSIRPEFTQALNSLAVVHAVKGDYDRAVYLLKKMVRLQPDNAGAYYNIACLYARQNKIEVSIDWLKKAIKRGYKNWNLIKTDKDLENIRGSSYYKQLIESH
jgi:tetratricopeptide (TPR) repeat protein